MDIDAPRPSSPPPVHDSAPESGHPHHHLDQDNDQHQSLQPPATPTRHDFVSMRMDTMTSPPDTPNLPHSSSSDSAATIAVSAHDDHVVAPTLGLPVELWVSIAQFTASSSLVASSSRLLAAVARSPAVHIAWTRSTIRAEYDRASREWDEKQRKQRQHQHQHGGAFGGQFLNQLFGGFQMGGGEPAQQPQQQQQPPNPAAAPAHTPPQGQPQPPQVQQQPQPQGQQSLPAGLVDPINIATGTANGIHWSVTTAHIPVPPGSTPEQVAVAANNMFAGLNQTPGMAAVAIPTGIPQPQLPQLPPLAPAPTPVPPTEPTDSNMSDDPSANNQLSDPEDHDGQEDDDDGEDDDQDDQDALTGTMGGGIAEGQILGGMAYIYVLASPTPLTNYLSTLFRPDYLDKGRVPNDPNVALASPVHPITKPFVDYLTSASHAQILSALAPTGPGRLAHLTPRPTLKSLISTLPALPTHSRDARKIRKLQRRRPLLSVVPDGLTLPVFFLLARDMHMFQYSVRRLVRALGLVAFGREAVPFRELWDRLMRLDSRKSSCTNAITLIQSYKKIEIGYACFLTLVAAMEWNVDALKMLIAPDADDDPSTPAARPLVADPHFTITQFLNNPHVTNMFISTVGQFSHAQVVAQLDWLESQGWVFPNANFRTVAVFAQHNYPVFCELFRRYDYPYLPTIGTDEIEVSQRRQMGATLVKLLLNAELREENIELIKQFMELRLLSLKAIATTYVVAMAKEWKQIQRLIEDTCAPRMADIYRLGIDTCFSPQRLKHLRTLTSLAAQPPYSLSAHTLLADHVQYYASNPMSHAYTGILTNPFGTPFAPPDTVSAIKRLVKNGLDKKFHPSAPTLLYHALLVGQLIEHVFSPPAVHMWRRAEEGQSGAGIEPKERFIKMMREAKRDEKRHLFASVVIRAVLLGLADPLQPRAVEEKKEEEEGGQDASGAEAAQGASHQEQVDGDGANATEQAVPPMDPMVINFLGPAPQATAGTGGQDQGIQPPQAQEQPGQAAGGAPVAQTFNFTFNFPINMPAAGAEQQQAQPAPFSGGPAPNANVNVNNNVPNPNPNPTMDADQPLAGLNQQQQAILGGVALAMQALFAGAAGGGGGGGGAGAPNPAALGAALGGMLGGMLAGGLPPLGGDDDDQDEQQGAADGGEGEGEGEQEGAPTEVPDPLQDRLARPPALPDQYWDLALERMVQEFPRELLPGGKESLGELHQSLGYFLAVAIRAVPKASLLDNQAVYGLLVQLVQYNAKATLRMLIADWAALPAWVWQVFKVHTPPDRGDLDRWLKPERVAAGIKAGLEAGEVMEARIIAKCAPRSAVKPEVLSVTQELWDKVDGGMQLNEPLGELASVPFTPRRPTMTSSPPTPEPEGNEGGPDGTGAGDAEAEVVLPGCTIM